MPSNLPAQTAPLGTLPGASVPAEWVRALTAPLHRRRWWCWGFAVLLLGFGVIKLWHGSWLNALVALSGTLSAWFLFRAASVLSVAHASLRPEDARAGFAALARYFLLSALTSALGLLLLIGAIVEAFAQVAHGL
ncbi:MAG: hypothetical protein KGI40_02080 [Xanthomonadaceae bacterium]|nr:hypothetical protein [Xanthomonadaceae bacterium]